MNKKINYISNNMKVYGILNQVNSDKTIAIICHARTSNKDSSATTSIANYLTENNYNNFRFDFVASGESEGTYKDYIITNMVNNLNDTLNILKEEYGYSSFILIGCSLGAFIASLANFSDYKIEKYISWYGAFNSSKRLFNIPSKKEKIAKKNGFYPIEKGWKLCYEYFIDIKQYLDYSQIKKSNIPKLFIHGTKDPYVDYKYSIKMNKKCKNSKLILINGGDHGFHDENNMQEALTNTINFIKEK